MNSSAAGSDKKRKKKTGRRSKKNLGLSRKRSIEKSKKYCQIINHKERKVRSRK
jgi:hypothetical protein